jgi:site-specific DNA-methyltransferase (adenine-specific)
MKSKHVFNYKAMREQNGGKQMKSVWRMLAPLKVERTFGKHPTQKPEALIQRCIESATDTGALVLDPFVGSGTTAVVSRKTGRRCLGIDADARYIAVAAARLQHLG